MLFLLSFTFISCKTYKNSEVNSIGIIGSADGPTGSLDKTNGKNIMDIFDKLKEQHKTIILVTHDEFISGYADRIVRIEDGEITEK